MNQPQPSAESSHRVPEVELLLACCRWPQTAADRDVIRIHVPEVQDWPRFLLLVQHHRVVPLTAHTLAAALADPTPEQAAVLDELRERATANTYDALRSLAELRRLIHAFEAQALPVRVLKGLPLAQQIFGDISLRATGDIDLLVDETSVLEADNFLRAAGYIGLFDIERFTPRRLAFYLAHWKDIAYRNPATGFEVDLHWRCFRNAAMPGNSLCATHTGETASFGAFEVRTLPPPETLLYLCVHGTLDGWLFLKSLADVAATVRTVSRTQLDALATLAATHGILPELTAALLLVRRYFDLEDWSGHLLPEANLAVRHILRFATHALEDNNFLGTRESIPARSMMAFEIGLRRDIRYRRELLLRTLYRARMWEAIPLPDVLFPLYPLLSPIEWILFRLRRRSVAIQDPEDVGKL